MLKNLLLLCILFLPVLNAFGQDTTYYDNNGKKVTSLQAANVYEIIHYNPADSNKVSYEDYYKSGQLRESASFSDYKKRQFDGKLKIYYKNGQLKEDIDFNNGNFSGELLTYWENGKPKRTDHYENGKFIKGKCFDMNGKAIPYMDYEVMPQFPGGETAALAFLKKEMKYPSKSRKNNIEGRVEVEFVIDKYGEVTNVKIKQGINDELNNEAIRVVKKMPKWKPGMQDGEAVNVQYTIPISFRLIEANK